MFIATVQLCAQSPAKPNVLFIEDQSKITVASAQQNVFEIVASSSAGDHFQAFDLINDASTISMHAANNWISKAFYEIAKGQLTQGLSYCTDFENYLD